MNAKLKYIKTLLENTEYLDENKSVAKDSILESLAIEYQSYEEYIDDQRLKILDGKNLIDAYIDIKGYILAHDTYLQVNTWDEGELEPSSLDPEKVMIEWWRMIDLALR